VIFFSLAMTALVFPGGVQPSVASAAGLALGVLLVFGTAWAVSNLDRNDLAGSFAAGLRRLVPRRFATDRGEVLEREPVAVHAQAADHADRHR